MRLRFLAIVLALTGCDTATVDAPVAAPTPIVIAHRGASAVAPEHTYSAYDRAVEQGADYIELDVQRTADGALIVVHDATLDRTAQGSVANCTGRVAEKMLAQVESCDVGSWFNSANPNLARPEFIGLRVPVLEDVIARYGATARLYIETKDPESYPGIEAGLVALLKKASITAGSTASPRVFIQSFSGSSLMKVKALDASLPLIQLLGATTPDGVIAQLIDIGKYAVGIGPREQDVNDALVETAHARCLLVHPYTVDDATKMLSLLAMGVDGIFTDRPDLLRDAISRMSPRTAGASRCAAVAL